MPTISILTKKENKVLAEFRNKLIKALGEDLLLIKLFGSKATGESRQESDIDVLLVLEKKQDWLIRRGTTLLRLSLISF